MHSVIPDCHDIQSPKFIPRLRCVFSSMPARVKKTLNLCAYSCLVSYYTREAGQTLNTRQHTATSKGLLLQVTVHASKTELCRLGSWNLAQLTFNNSISHNTFHSAVHSPKHAALFCQLYPATQTKILGLLPCMTHRLFMLLAVQLCSPLILFISFQCTGYETICLVPE